MKLANKIIILTAILSLANPACLLATDYSSANFLISNPIIGEGGTAAAEAANFLEKGSVSGPQAIGKSQSENFTIRSGFQYYDETPPQSAAAIINDGAGEDEDEQAALNSLSANWNGFYDPESGLSLLTPYEYTIFRNSDGKYWNGGTLSWQTNEYWTATTLNSVTVYPVYLDTGDEYFFKVRAHNNAKIVSASVISDGITVIPSLSFILDGNAIELGELGAENNFTSTATGTAIKINTNAYYGYSIAVWSPSPLTHKNYPSVSIGDFSGSNENPRLWEKDCAANTSYCGFGYTSDDSYLSGGVPDRFTQGGPRYAGFSHIYPGDIVADHTEFITGQTGAADDQFSISYKASTSGNQISGQYSATIIYTITPNF